MNNNKADEANEEFSKSILNRYQTGLETSMRVVILSLTVFLYCI